jgi:hypothetical protein
VCLSSGQQLAAIFMRIFLIHPFHIYLVLLMIEQTPAEILIQSAIKTVGKREFIKTVERIFRKEKKETIRQSTIPSQEIQCEARVKGERTGIKIGRFVQFEQARCHRPEIDSSTHLCAIHTNQSKKLGELPFGRVTEELNDNLRKTFI